jgi:hypothetical protein
MPPSDTASTPSTSLAHIPLPEFDTLTQAQVRGAACVFDGVALSAENAVDLGERKIRRPGEQVAWFPRACRRCAMEQSMVALQEHSGSCEPCLIDFTQCETGRALVRAVRDARR